MKIKFIESRQVHGISVKTNNIDELDSTKAKIGRLHQQFDKQVTVNYVGGECVYAIYYDYESDASGVYSVMCGFDGDPKDIKSLTTLEIQTGKYLVFSATGKIPKIVIETWGEIWEYFSSEGCKYRRTYSTDFEFYKGLNEVEIYIAIE